MGSLFTWQEFDSGNPAGLCLLWATHEGSSWAPAANRVRTVAVSDRGFHESHVLRLLPSELLIRFAVSWKAAPHRPAQLEIILHDMPLWIIKIGTGRPMRHWDWGVGGSGITNMTSSCSHACTKCHGRGVGTKGKRNYCKKGVTTIKAKRITPLCSLSHYIQTTTPPTDIYVAEGATKLKATMRIIWSVLTTWTDRGVLKSTPPCRRNPQGVAVFGRRSCTVYFSAWYSTLLIFGLSEATRDSRSHA